MEYTFLFVNVGGDFLSIAMRIKEEGYPVFYYKQKGMSKGREDTAVGLLEKDEIVDDLWEVVNKVPKEQLIILFDDNGYGDMADFLKNNGYMVVGGSAFADKIEYERGLGTKLMAKIGLELPTEHSFNNFDQAISYLESQPEDYRCVFKPEGEDFAGSSKTYTGKNRQDVIDYIKWIKEDTLTHHYTITKFLLQDFIEGYEADFSAYFDGEKFMDNLVLLDLEEKKSGDGNKGEATGCMGNILVNVGSSKYFDEYISKLAPILKKTNFVGCIAINNIFSKENGLPYGLEFTPRFGWDAHLTELALIKDGGLRVCDFYIALAKKTKFEFPIGRVGIAVRAYTGSVSLDKDEVAGRYFSFPESIKDNMWFISASKKSGAYCIEDNPVLIAQTVDETVSSSIKSVYEEILPKVNIPDIYYRNEIGKRATEVIEFLGFHRWI